MRQEGMQHGHEHAPWTWTCTMDIEMQRGQVHAACPI
jgi:hypothetical protein